MKSSSLTRRCFLRLSVASAPLVSLVSRSVVAGGATPPSEPIRIASIGVGGMGAGDMGAVAPGNHIVALCDVDEGRAADTLRKFPAAKQYRDFRR